MVSSLVLAHSPARHQFCQTQHRVCPHTCVAFAGCRRPAYADNGWRTVIISGFYDSIGLSTKSTDAEKAIADEWLALLGMSERADEPFNRLSYGDQRLILIARAMVKHPPLLILDEPCLGLDDMNRQLVLALVERICLGSETTVLYVNHREQDRIPGIDNHLTLSRPFGPDEDLII